MQLAQSSDFSRGLTHANDRTVGEESMGGSGKGLALGRSVWIGCDGVDRNRLPTYGMHPRERVKTGLANVDFGVFPRLINRSAGCTA
jgi:hypothetical protein